jgi:dimethylaniline monooxygenase (N-oxide forming)
MTGAVQVRDDVISFGSKDVVFKDGGTEEIDAVVFATGYDYKFKFLDDDIVSVVGNEPTEGLYRFMFPVRLRHPTLALIGFVQPIGSVIPIAEMQARWHTRILAGMNLTLIL